METQKLGPVLVLLLGAFACNMTGVCTLDTDCLPQNSFCYVGKHAKPGARGVCVYGAPTTEAKITAWRLLLPNQQEEVAPFKWDKQEVEAGWENAEALWVGMAEAVVEVEVVGLEPSQALKVWTDHGVNAVCQPPAERKRAGELWTCTFQEGWAASALAAPTITVKVQAGEGEAREREYRLLCSHNLSGLVGEPFRHPLAMSGKRLLLSSSSGDKPDMPTANNSLYVFDTAACSWVGSLHTGTVQGTMVALGDTGRVAVAIGNHGPEGRKGQRLSMVNVSAEEPSFMDSEECRQEADSGVVFNQGLSLLNFPNVLDTSWRLAAPANHVEPGRTRLVAYMPDAESAGCVSSSPIESPFRTPLSQDPDNKAVVGIYGDAGVWIRGWVFNEAKGEWAEDGPPPRKLEASIAHVSALAVVKQNFWVRDLSFESPVAVDSQGRVYLAVKPDGSEAYHLQREIPVLGLENEGSIDANSTPFEGAPVGSPLLGEPLPGEEARVYVVTTAGKVLAYGVDLGEPVWTYNLGVGIAPSAQPVLSGDTLWVVGARGEIRGLRVGGGGLHRTAQWPKAFHDNCNTSSHIATWDSLPGCF